MGTGFAGIGRVPAEVHNHQDLDREYPEGDALFVSHVWAPGGNGVELTAGGLDEHIYLTNEAAIHAAGLLLRASAPANIPGNGYEKWAAKVREVVAKALDPAQDWEYEEVGPHPFEPSLHGAPPF